MKINKKLLTALLLTAFISAGNISYGAMNPEASRLYQQACSAEHQQDLKEAISKLEQAIQITGPDVMLYTKLAGIYSEIDDYDKALETYKKVIDINPDDAFIYISIGSIYENQGKYNEALEYYTKALDIFPEYKYNYYNIGNVQYQLKQYKEAIGSYNTFLETYSGHTESRENLASSYFALKDYNNAMKQYRILYDKNPEGFKHYTEYGLSLLNTDNAEKSVDFLEKAIELDPESDSAHLGLAQAYQDMGKKEESYEQYQIVLKNVPNLNTVRLDYANLLADMDKNTEAINQYNMYIKAFPNDSKGYANLAYVYKKLKNYEKAIENYSIAISKNENNIDLKKEIANCYHNANNYEKALEYYNEILETQPDDFNIKFNRALVIHALKHYEEAISLYKELLNVRSEKVVKTNMASAMVSRGHELVDAQEYNSALEYFKNSIKEGYNDGYVYYGMARAYRGLENNTKASENYEKAISIDPDKTLYSAEYSDFISSMYAPKVNVQESGKAGELPAISLSMEDAPKINESNTKTTSVTAQKNEDFIAEGDKNYKSNNYDAALKNYQDALALVPNDAVTLLKIGNIYQLKEDNTKAINYYQKAIIVNPDYTDGWFNLGLAYANENNLTDSQKSLEKVIELDSDYNFGYAYYALGMAFENQGKNDEAIKNYKAFIKHNNDKELINTVQTKIKKLQ